MKISTITITIKLWDIILMHLTYNSPNEYFYGGNGIYYNNKGDAVPFDEVLHNYLIPGLTYISSDNNPFSVANDMKDGWRCFNFRAFGKDNFMLVKGALGSISPEPNGGIIFSNSTASVTTLSAWEFTDESGETSVKCS